MLSVNVEPVPHLAAETEVVRDGTTKVQQLEAQSDVLRDARDLGYDAPELLKRKCARFQQSRFKTQQDDLIANSSSNGCAKATITENYAAPPRERSRPAHLQAQAAERFVYAFAVRALMGRGTALAHNPDRRNLKSGSRES
jgi:hypothetical protein